MKVSVVLTTYNGIKYIEELLDSLRLQSRKIDELLVCDDCSTDGTPEKIKSYAQKYMLNWNVQINVKNKGWKRNFRDAILQACGEIVFPCDQDDVWALDKVEKMTDVMEKDANILLLSSDYTPFYEQGGHKVEECKIGSELIEKVPFNSHFAIGNRPGCVMAIRRSLLEKVRPIWEEEYPHDAFLWTCANFCDGCFIYHEALIQYRRHSANTTNHVTRDKDAVVLSLKRNLRLTDWMLTEHNEFGSEQKQQLISEFRSFAKLRLDLLANKRLGNFLRLIRYRKYYFSVKQEIGDIVLMFK